MIKLKRLRYQILAKNKIKTITWWIPLALTFNYSLPNFYDILEKSCHILHIHNQLHKIFYEKPIIAHNQHRNLKDIIGDTTFTNTQEVHKPLKITRGSCKPCLKQMNNCCCKQVIIMKKFESNVTNCSYKIFHNISCKNTYLIYLL